MDTPMEGALSDKCDGCAPVAYRSCVLEGESHSYFRKRNWYGSKYHITLFRGGASG